MAEIYYSGDHLEKKQKNEYVKMHLFISGLAMAADILSKGCLIRLRNARHVGKFVICDAPVVLRSRVVHQIEEMEGWMPLSPHVLMEIKHIGSGLNWACHDGDISIDTVEDINRRLIGNAERWVYFSSTNQRAKYLDWMTALRT